jgi:hypothetical protein
LQEDVSGKQVHPDLNVEIQFGIPYPKFRNTPQKTNTDILTTVPT